MAVSLDGFIARKDGEIDWIPSSVKESFCKEYNSSEYLICGTNTYNYIFERWGDWPYKGKKTFVVANTRRDVIQDDSLTFLTDNPSNTIQKLKEETETDLVVIGGGKLITSLINTELLDELTVCTVPIILGDGIKFFGKTIGSKWKLVENYSINNKNLCAIYHYENNLENYYL